MLHSDRYPSVGTRLKAAGTKRALPSRLSSRFESRNEDRRRLYLKVGLWLITLVVTQHVVTHPQIALAQTPGAQNAERVDPLTGKLSLEIPLVGYPGRAGNSQAVNIRYASKVWELQYRYSFTEYGPFGGEIPHPVYEPVYSPGWASSLGLPGWGSSGSGDQLYDEYGSPVDEVPQGAGLNAPYYYVDRLIVSLPDGSTHDLRKNDNLRQYHQPAPLGNFYAVDGSRIYFDILSYPHRLVLPDGSRYEYRQYPDPEQHLIRFIDRNGNTSTFDQNLQQWSDTLGRVIGLPPLTSATPGDQLYTVPGFASAPVTYVFRFKWLADARTNPSDPLRYPGDFELHGNPHDPANGLTPSLFNSIPGPVEVPIGEYVVSTRTLFNPVVLSEVVLPNGETYKFTYNVWGELDNVIFPSSGYERFRYAGDDPTQSGIIFNQVERPVAERWVSPSGLATDEARWVHGNGEMTAPDGSRLRHYGFWQAPGPSTGPFGFTDCRSGLPSEDRVYDSSGNMVRRSLNEWTKSGPLPGGYQNATRDPRITKEVDIILDTGSGPAFARATLYFYDSEYNVRESREYGFAEVSDRALAETGVIGSIPLGPLVRTTEWTFVTDPAYASFKGLEKTMVVKDALGNIVSNTEFFYDETPLQNYSSNIVGWIDPLTSARGNVTTVRRWISSTDYVDIHSKYDMFGNEVEVSDGTGHVTQFEYSSEYNYGYQTRITSPVPDPSGVTGSATPLATTNTFDMTTGLVTSVTDANNQTTFYEYNDPLSRLTKAIRPEGGSNRYEYGDAPGNVFIRKLASQDAYNTIESYQYFDGFHRPSRMFQNEGATWRVTETQYDSVGRTWRSSNPYRSTILNGPVDPSAVWTTNAYDATGRVILVTAPDGGQVRTEYLGNTVTVTDQANKVTKTVADHQGRSTQVIEDPGGSSPLVTNYIYDVLGRLRKVSQSDTESAVVQERFFMYDMLGRIIRTRHSEQDSNPALALYDEVTDHSEWSLSYEYDNSDNLKVFRDARGVATNYDYDAMGRLTTRSYTVPAGVAATPTTSFFYDGAGVSGGVLNSKGKTTKVSSSAATFTFDEFNAEGGVRHSTQTTDGQAYTMSYEYDLAGHMTAQTYPSGRVVRNDFDVAGRLKQITGQAPGQTTPTAYVSQIDYAPHWGSKALKFGNNLWETTSYNLNLQRVQKALGTSNTDTSFWKLENFYDTLSIGNNGDLQKQVVTLPGLTLTQEFSYDSYDRLGEALENGGASWRQKFIYDRFGNRRFDVAATTPAVFGPNPSADLHTNHLQGYGYDSVGNVVSDPAGHVYAYDADNRQVSYDNGLATYVYDGNGRRVKKTVGGVSTVYVYNLVNQLIAEYSSTPPSQGGTSYITSDQLDTPRIVTDAAGNIRARHDYAPFGEELSAPLGGRSTAQMYVQDNLNQKFTSKERDVETGLDFFSARYYASSLGRFMSVDPLLASATITDPQTWNRYVYVTNNPLKYTDISGFIKRHKDGSIKYTPRRGEDGLPTTTTMRPQGASRQYDVEVGYIETDNGKQIEVTRSIDKSPNGDSDCHGLSFADGEYWINNNQVNTILEGDGYKETSTPVVGDIAVYYDVDAKGKEVVVHSATVTAVDSNGNVTEVSGYGGDQPGSKSTSPENGFSRAPEKGKTRKIRVFHSNNRTDQERQQQAERAKGFDKAQARLDKAKKEKEEKERKKREEAEKKRQKDEEKKRKKEESEKSRKPGEKG